VGHPESLHSLSVLLNEKETRKDDNLDQSRVPFSKRKKEFRLVYLPVSVPFHSQLLKGGEPSVLFSWLGASPSSTRVHSPRVLQVRRSGREKT